MAISNLEIKVKGFLKTALSAEASTTTIDVDFVNEDTPSTVITLQTDTLLFEIDPLNKTGKGSEICLAASNTPNTPITGRTRFSTVTRGLPMEGHEQTGSSSRAKSWDEGTEVAIATGSMAKLVNLLISYLATNPSNTTFSGTLVFSGANSFTGSFKFPVYADSTARDVAIPSPSNGMTVYLTAPGVLYQYISGAWTTFASGTTLIAADHTAGKVDIASAADIAATTAIDATSGAINVIPVSQTVKTSSGAADENKFFALDASGQVPVGFLPTNVQEAATAFGSTDITGSELESLSAGSNASTLHYHDFITNTRLSGRYYFDFGNAVLTAASGTATNNGGYYALTTQAANNAIAKAELLLSGVISNISSDIPSFLVKTKFSAATAQDAFIGVSGDAFVGTSVENSVFTLDHFGFVIEDGTVYGSCADGATQQKTSALVVTITNEIEWAATFDGTTVTFYVDGASVGTLNTNVPNSDLNRLEAAIIADASGAAKTFNVLAVGGLGCNR